MSVHAIVRAISHQTMRIRGNIKKKAINFFVSIKSKKKAIIILIDSISTHNFLDITVAKHIGCIIKQDKP